MSQQHLDIVLPCYNPIEGWSRNIVQHINALNERLPTTILHLYLVNDGAKKGITDTDISYLKEHIPNFTYIDYTINQGKGYALRQGIAQSKNEICIYTDVDFPYQEDSFLALYQELLKEEHDVVVGTRSADYYKKVPFIRIVISKLLKFCIKLFLNTPVTDTQCGLKGFNKKGKLIFLNTTINRYLFDLEFIYLVGRRSKATIKPIEVILRDGVVFSNMPLKLLFPEALSFLKILLKR